MKIYALLKFDEKGNEKVLLISEDMNKIFSKVNYYQETLYLQTWSNGKKGTQYLLKKYNEKQDLNNSLEEPGSGETAGVDEESSGGLFLFGMDSVIMNDSKSEDDEQIQEIIPCNKWL